MRAPHLPVLFHPDCNRRLRNRTDVRTDLIAAQAAQTGEPPFS